MSTLKKEITEAKKDKVFESVLNLSKANEEPKKQIPAMIEKFAEKQKPTAEDRISRIAHFEAHSRRFQLLKDKSNDLKMFDAGNDKTNAKIILKHNAGFEFEVSNSNVIKKVRDAMETELNILLSEAENEILTFEI